MSTADNNKRIELAAINLSRIARNLEATERPSQYGKSPVATTEAKPKKTVRREKIIELPPAFGLTSLDGTVGLIPLPPITIITEEEE